MSEGHPIGHHARLVHAVLGGEERHREVVVADRQQHAEIAVAAANLSAAGDLREAAANLFSHLQELDRSGAPVIAAAPVPCQGLGEAINDRLARAAAPRDNPDPRP